MQVTFVGGVWGSSGCPLPDLSRQCADFFSFSGMQCGITAGWIAESWMEGPVNDMQAETGRRRCGLQPLFNLWRRASYDLTARRSVRPLVKMSPLYWYDASFGDTHFPCPTDTSAARVSEAKKPKLHFHNRPLDGPFTQVISLSRLPPPPFSLALARPPLSSSLPTKWMTAFRNTRVRHDSEARTLCHLCSTCFDASAARKAEGMRVRRTGRGNKTKGIMPTTAQTAN